MSGPPGRTLIDAAKRGDEDAFAAIATDAADRLYAGAFRILRDPDLARDAVQQALLNAWRDLHALRDPDRLDAWLYRLVLRACYAEARHRRRAIVLTHLAVVHTVSDRPLGVIPMDIADEDVHRSPVGQSGVSALVIVGCDPARKGSQPLVV